MEKLPDDENMHQNELTEEQNNLIDEYIKLLKENRKKAEEFYSRKVLPKILERISRYSEFVHKKIQEIYGYEEIAGLIQTVGFSLEPLQMVQEAFGPEKVFYIATKDTESKINLLYEFNKLPISSIEHEILNNNVTPEKIYEVIRDKIKKFFDNQRNVVVDITGGKKSISGGALLAAHLLKLPVVYVDYKKYLPEVRKPMPFMEFIHVFEPPETILSDVEEEKIVALLQNYNFSKAHELSAEMSEKAKNPLKFFVYKYLAETYRLWDNFAYSSALQNFRMSLEYADKYGLKLENKKHVEKNIIFLEEVIKVLELQKMQEIPLDTFILTSAYSTTLFIADLLNRAERFKKLEKFNFCALLSYRTIELIIQYFLYSYGINPHQPDVKQYLRFAGNSKTTIQDIEDNIVKYRKKYFGESETEIELATGAKSKTAPKIDFNRKITLLDGVLLLKAANVDLFKNFDISKLRTFVELRNKSVLTHGLSKVNKRPAVEFLAFVKKVLENLLPAIYSDWKTWISNAQYPTYGWRVS